MTTKQKQSLDIDLNAAAKCPSDKLVKCYEDAQAMDTWIDYNISPAFVNNRRIWMASKGSGNPVRHSIFALYRRKTNRGEYLFAYDSISTKDYFGNSLMSPVELFRWSKPSFSRTYGINPGTIKTSVNADEMRPQPSEAYIEGHELVYDHTFEEIKPQLIKWYEEGIISPECNLYIWGSSKFKIQDWTDFINLPFEDLELLAKAGNRFDGIYNKGDSASVDTIRKIVKSELEKNIKI